MAIAVWVRGLAVPIPLPGPCDASAALLHAAAAAIKVIGGAVRDIGVRVRNEVMKISLQTALSKIRRQSTPGLARGKILKPRRVPFAFIFVAHSFRTHSSRWPQIAWQRCGERFGADVTPDPRRAFMQFTKIMGLAAVGALLALAAPAERANALSLSNPGAAAAVQDDARLATTEVHWRHRHHHRWHRWHHRHHHHRHWHRW
jgi:hypothetical protein